MKNAIRAGFYLLLFFLFMVTGSNILAQNCVCATCGRSCSSIATSGHIKGYSCYVAPVIPTTKSSSVSSPASPTNSSNQSTDLILLQGVMGIMNAFFDASAANEQKKLEEQRIAAELKAQQEAEEKRLKEEAENAKFDKTMKLYKPISNTDLKIQPIDEPINPKKVHYLCKLTSYSGLVQIQKANGTKYFLSEGIDIDLEVGDKILTGSNGRIKIHFDFENGGKNFIVNKNTKFEILESDDGFQFPGLFDGDFHVSKGFMNDLQREIIESDFGKTLKKKLQIRTGSGTAAVRGTEFVISADSLSGTEVVVFEGSVELMGNVSEKLIIIEKGFKGSVSPEGLLSGPYEFDITNIEKWWEE